MAKPTRSNACFVAVMAMVLAVASPASAKPVPEVTHDGLHLVKHARLERVWEKPGVDFAHYKKLIILDCFVAFKKNWQRDADFGTRIGAKQMDEIKKKLAAEFRKVFLAELEKKGRFEVVDQPGPDVLTVRPAIIDLTIEAPDGTDNPDEMVFSGSSGSMELYVELYDASTSAILYRAIDAEAGGSTGFFEWQNGTTNMASGDATLRKWARGLRETLNEISAP